MTTFVKKHPTKTAGEWWEYGTQDPAHDAFARHFKQNLR